VTWAGPVTACGTAPRRNAMPPRAFSPIGHRRCLAIARRFEAWPRKMEVRTGGARQPLSISVGDLKSLGSEGDSGSASPGQSTEWLCGGSGVGHGPPVAVRFGGLQRPSSSREPASANTTSDDKATAASNPRPWPAARPRRRGERHLRQGTSSNATLRRRQAMTDVSTASQAGFRKSATRSIFSAAARSQRRRSFRVCAHTAGSAAACSRMES
jgi:hypothetical protein